MDAAAIVEALAAPWNGLPKAALVAAADQWPTVGPLLLRQLEDAAAGAAITESSERSLFLGIYLMAQMRNTRAFKPLCALARDGLKLDILLGDGITEQLSVILARVYDGDVAPLRSLIEDPSADEFIRDAALGALIWLTHTGKLDRGDTAAYLRTLYETMQPREESYAWFGWQQAVAMLGFADMVPLVDELFERGWIGTHIMGRDHFQEDLRSVLAAADPASVFPGNIKDDGELDDVVGMMADWHCFKPQPPLRPTKLEFVRPNARPAPPVITPVRNPHRNVGRNDPCPCGSGTKFKKCCLGKAA